MAKKSGLGDNFYYGAFDFSGDIQALGAIGGGPAALNVTGINKSALERIGGHRDGRIEYTAFFNPGALGTGITPVANDLPTTDLQILYARGTALGSPAASLVGKQLNFDGTRAEDGMLTFAVNEPANGFGLEWGELHTAGKRSDTGATNGTGVSSINGLASANGLQAYLHVFSFTGTSVTIKLQESSDDGAGDAYADVVGGAFTAVTAAGVQRIATATNLAVERYLRVVTTGTFSQCTFAVNVVRNATVPAF